MLIKNKINNFIQMNTQFIQMNIVYGWVRFIYHIQVLSCFVEKLKNKIKVE